MLLSILVTTCNKAAYLEATLRNLAVQTAGRDGVELVVANDGSTDGTDALLQRLQPELGFSRVDTAGEGRAGGRNRGIRATSGGHVLLVDDDIVLGPGFVENLLRAIRRHPDRVHIGRLRNVAATHVAPLLAAARAPGFAGFGPLDEYSAHNAMFEASRVLFAGRPEDGGEARPAVWWAVATGGNVCLPRAAFESAGGFDEAFKTWGPEDSELCYRMFRLGWSAAFNADCRLYHLDHPRDNTGTGLSMIRNVNYLVKKHGKPCELMSYLQFTNGLVTMEAFNNECAELYGMPRMEIDEFYMTLRYASSKDQLIRWRRA